MVISRSKHTRKPRVPADAAAGLQRASNPQSPAAPVAVVRNKPTRSFGRLRASGCVLQADCRNQIVRRLPSKAPFSKRFEEAVGQGCESAPVRRVARQFGLSPSTVRAIDLRYLKRWAASRRKPALRQMGIDEMYLGKKQQFLTVVSNLETGEPLWFGRERKKETLDEFFEQALKWVPTKRDPSRLCGHVGTVPAKPGAMGAELPDHL